MSRLEPHSLFPLAYRARLDSSRGVCMLAAAAVRRSRLSCKGCPCPVKAIIRKKEKKKKRKRKKTYLGLVMSPGVVLVDGGQLSTVVVKR